MASRANEYEPPKSGDKPTTVTRNEMEDADWPPFAPATRWAIASAILLAVALVQAGADFFVHVRQYAYYRHLEDAGQIDPVVEERLMRWDQTLNMTNGAIRYLTAVPLLTWMYRAHRNLEALGHHKLDSGRIWAVLCWFIPVLNLFCPYQVMRELWWRSDPKAKDIAETATRPDAVFWWWLMWLGAMATELPMIYWTDFSTISATLGYLKITLLYTTFEIVAAGLAIYVMLKIDRFQFLRYRIVQS
jgi:hypothetical protein